MKVGGQFYTSYSVLKLPDDTWCLVQFTSSQKYSRYHRYNYNYNYNYITITHFGAKLRVAKSLHWLLWAEYVRMTFSLLGPLVRHEKHLGNACVIPRCSEVRVPIFSWGFYWLWRLNTIYFLHFDCLLHLFLVCCSLAERGMQPMKLPATVDISEQISKRMCRSIVYSYIYPLVI